MPRPPNKTSEELLDLARAIRSQRGRVTVPALRQVAGGGSYRRLKSVVDTAEAEAAPGMPGETLPRSEEKAALGIAAAAARFGGRPGAVPLDTLAYRDLMDQVQRVMAQLEGLLQAHGRVLDLLQEDREVRRMENEAFTRLIENQSRLIDQVCRMVDVAIKAVQVGLRRPLD